MNRYYQRFKSMEQRFWEKVSFGFGENACWIWSSTLTGNHYYGSFWDGKRHSRAHRISWEICNGKIPEGMFVCHSCDNPACVNPNHLFLGDFGDNMQDMWDKNRHPINNMGRKSETMIGENNPNSVLSKSDVLWIRELYDQGVSISNIAEYYSLYVQKPAIFKIVHRKTWAHV